MNIEINDELLTPLHLPDMDMLTIEREEIRVADDVPPYSYLYTCQYHAEDGPTVQIAFVLAGDDEFDTEITNADNGDVHSPMSLAMHIVHAMEAARKAHLEHIPNATFVGE